jgi:histidyl-tRNA synthetase
MSKKIDTNSYKGVRDFYPKEMHIEKYLFDGMRAVSERYGYVEYGASPLEPAELYKAKSGEEIINEQTYTFTDRGDREVTLRPEMTPTVARMVAGKKRDLPFPLRWYSIPNLFRYENPQRGRLREHFQLNVDIFGVTGLDADVEIISVASDTLKEFGATPDDFSILINSRKIFQELCAHFSISTEQQYTLSKIIDKKNKVEKDVFKEAIEKILLSNTDIFIGALDRTKNLIEILGEDNLHVQNLVGLIEKLENVGITNVVFTPTLMRGFDYYTDIVFEIFDTSPENRRSLFGGGRYDNLTELFSDDKVPAVGFGMGDVTLLDFLTTHNLLPEYRSEVTVMLASVKTDSSSVVQLAQTLRSKGVNVATETSDKSVGDKIKTTLKLAIPFFIAVGEDEVTSRQYKVKNLLTEQETVVSEQEIVDVLKKG